MKLEDGKAVVSYARGIIEGYFSGPVPKPPDTLNEILEKPRGVFVTLKTYPSDELRGCIGYSEPIMSLGKALRDVAVSSAIRDPRFPPVKEDELKELVVEVSVLTPPVLIKIKDPREYPAHIEIGRDGLIVEKGWSKGLLLPQVPVEWKWDREEFLSHTCMKAGLSPDAWLVPDTKIYKFSAQVFGEKKPSGEIEKKALG